MVAIDNTIISDDIFTKKFCCDLSKCKGHCCIEGDAGAPLEFEEIEQLEKYYTIYKKYMTEAGIALIEKSGEFCEIDGWVKPEEGMPDMGFTKAITKEIAQEAKLEFTTPIINGKDCAYIMKDDNGYAFCAIEKAYLLEEIDFRKPISCHLFPIRIQSYKEYDAVNYFDWDICKSAVIKGKRENIGVLEYLKEPLIRKYGEEWFEQAIVVKKQLFN